MISIKAMMAVLFAFAPTAQAAFDPGNLRFLSVHHDPAHEAVVAARLSTASPVPFAALPAEHQMPANLRPAVKSQGSRDSCSHFATVALTEAYYLALSKKFAGLSLSEECLLDVRDWMHDQGKNYTGADKPETRPDPDGDYPEYVLRTVQLKGIPIAKRYPSGLNCVYEADATRGNSVSLVNYLKAFPSSAAYGKGIEFSIDHAPTLESVKASLAKNVPVAVNVLVYSEMMHNSAWNFDPTLDTDQTLVGGHAVILTGYQTQGKQIIFTFKNSWGTEFGQAGYGTLDSALLTHGWAYDPLYDVTVSTRR